MQNLRGPFIVPYHILQSRFGRGLNEPAPLVADRNGRMLGECFSLLKNLLLELANTNTQEWVKGESFFNQTGNPTNTLYKPSVTGAAIATFDENGKVYKSTDPRSTHGAIFLFNAYGDVNGRRVPGFYVIDQWTGQRLGKPSYAGIRFIGTVGASLRSNDARAFSLVMLRK